MPDVKTNLKDCVRTVVPQFPDTYTDTFASNTMIPLSGLLQYPEFQYASKSGQKDVQISKHRVLFA